MVRKNVGTNGSGGLSAKLLRKNSLPYFNFDYSWEEMVIFN